MDLPNSKNYEGIDNETLSSFRSMGLFTDVKFLVNGKELRAHKIVLASRSDVFQAMFSSDMAESHNHITINIEDVDDGVFTTFLDYMYVLDESLVKSCPIDLLVCADKYNVDPLLSACDRFFTSTISKDNIFDYLDISETFRRQKIKDSAINFLRANITLMVYDLEGWSRLKNRFETITQLVGSYSRFINFKECSLSPDFWVKPNVNESCLLNGYLSVESDDTKNYSFTMEVERDARGECLSGILNLVGEYLSSVKVYVLVEIESNNQLLLHDKLLLRWSKMCSVDTSMDMECWRLIDGHPLPCMNTGPIIFMLPNESIFDQTTNLKIALTSLRPQYSSNSPTELITPSELALSELSKPHPTETAGFLIDFGLKSNFDFQWSGFCPPLTVENAPSTLCRIAKGVHQDEMETVTSKYKVLQFMKFHAADIIKSSEWTTLQSFPDLLRDLLLEMAQ